MRNETLNNRSGVAFNTRFALTSIPLLGLCLLLFGTTTTMADVWAEASSENVCLHGDFLLIYVWSDSDCEDFCDPPICNANMTTAQIIFEGVLGDWGYPVWVYSCWPNSLGDLVITATDGCADAEPVHVNVYLDMGITPSARTITLQCTNTSQASYALTGCHPRGATWDIPAGEVLDPPTISDGIVSAYNTSDPGEYVVIATSNDDASYQADADLTVQLDCDPSHHTTFQGPGFQPDNRGSCPAILGVDSNGAVLEAGWWGESFNARCPNNWAKVGCVTCDSLNSSMHGTYCVVWVINGLDRGHCLYSDSDWSDSRVWTCVCGAVIKKSYWKVTEEPAQSEDLQVGPGIGYGYYYEWSSETGGSGPQCFNPIGYPRPCNVNGIADY